VCETGGTQELARITCQELLSEGTTTAGWLKRLVDVLGERLVPAGRFDGTPFTDRGFEHVPSLAPVATLLAELLVA
jgi:hypothetical protein